MSEILTTLIVDAVTGEIIERELTEEELEQLEIDATNEANRNAEQDAKAAARESALAKLADLGLTAEEIAAL